MIAELHEVPGRLRPTLNLLVSGCLRDGRIRSAWLEGSFAVGLEDEWSDIDLHLLVHPSEGFDPVAWLSSLTPLVLADAIPGLPGAFVCLTPEWVHIDIVVHSPADELDPRTARRILLDKESAIVVGVPSPTRMPSPGSEKAWFPRRQVQIFLYFMGTAVASVHRKDIIALARTTAAMRDQLLVQLMLAENGSRADTAAKRLTGQLSDAQLACLQQLPALPLDEAGQRDALRSIAQAYLSRARLLAANCGAEWPAELESATKRLWSDELGIDL